MERVFFTWPDGRFRYTCAGCGACCKGHGIGLDVAGGQLVQLVARRPEIVPFLRRRGDAITAFNPRDACWFLTGEGMCRIEVEDGRAAKPASCRLFPFNRVFRIGAHTVVDYNSVICPLEVVPSGGVTHAEVVAEIAAISDAAVVGTPLPARDAGAEGAALAASEGAIAAAMFAAADDATTGAPAGDASDRKGAGDRVGAVLGAAWGAQADAAALDAERTTQVDAFTAIAGAAWEPPSHATLAAALWLSPSLRFNELYGPRQYATRSAMPPVLARMWLAWLGFAALGERLAGRALGLQELTTIWSEQAPLMHAVARWTEVPRLKPGPIELPGIDPGGFVRTLGQSFVDNKQARKPLSALVAAVVTKTSSDPVIRVAGLKSADAILRAGFA